jgi:hypothetical protein
MRGGHVVQAGSLDGSLPVVFPSPKLLRSGFSHTLNDDDAVPTTAARTPQNGPALATTAPVR